MNSLLNNKKEPISVPSPRKRSRSFGFLEDGEVLNVDCHQTPDDEPPPKKRSRSFGFSEDDKALI